MSNTRRSFPGENFGTIALGLQRLIYRARGKSRFGIWQPGSVAKTVELWEWPGIRWGRFDVCPSSGSRLPGTALRRYRAFSQREATINPVSQLTFFR